MVVILFIPFRLSVAGLALLHVDIRIVECIIQSHVLSNVQHLVVSGKYLKLHIFHVSFKHASTSLGIFNSLCALYICTRMSFGLHIHFHIHSIWVWSFTDIIDGQSY